MSEHSPLPWRIDIGKDCDGNPQVWHVLDAEGRFVITTDCGFYTRFEGDYDLIVNAVNSIDRLRKANEELVKTLNNIITAVVHFKVKAEWCAEVADQVLKEVQEILNHSHESSESDK